MSGRSGRRRACQLDGFLRPQAVDRLVADALALTHGAHRSEAVHNVYFEDVDSSLPDDDPRRVMERASQATIAYDMVPADAAIRALYEWELAAEFVAAALDKHPFYRNADPLGGLNVVYYEEGDELGWHFDRAEFVVTLMLQPAAVAATSSTSPTCAARATRTTRRSAPARRAT